LHQKEQAKYYIFILIFLINSRSDNMQAQVQTQTSFKGFYSRKLHSLLGVIPLGLFIFEHVFMNSLAYYGQETFMAAVEILHSLPFLWVLEVFLIALPLTYHALFGLYLAYQAGPSLKEYPTMRNWMFYLQRISGVVIFIFVLYHVISFNFGPLAELSAYEKVTTSFTNPLLLSFYVLGLTSAIFHFVNGLWGFAINWGIITGTRAQRVFSYLTMGAFVIFMAFGIRMVLSFL
jgi:succinate dehydrogenase / fumarate reductase cytochrome b subunit